MLLDFQSQHLRTSIRRTCQGSICPLCGVEPKGCNGNTQWQLWLTLLFLSGCPDATCHVLFGSQPPWSPGSSHKEVEAVPSAVTPSCSLLSPSKFTVNTPLCKDLYAHNSQISTGKKQLSPTAHLYWGNHCKDPAQGSPSFSPHFCRGACLMHSAAGKGHSLGRLPSLAVGQQELLEQTPSDGGTTVAALETN